MYTSIFYLSLAALATAQSSNSSSGGLVGALQANQDLSSLAQAIALVPGLAETLAGSSNITILAPINSAFEAVPADSAVGQAIANNATETVAALLSYHVLTGTYESSDFSATPAFAKTLLTNNSAVANVTGGQNVGLVQNGDAYNIISGDDAISNVTQADIKVGYITIHKIGSVLTLPSNVSATLASQDLTSAGDAIGSTTLGPVLNSAKDLTIFIPNNAAFEAISSTLANASAETVSSILTYHAVVGTVAFSSDLTNTTIRTVNGESVKITVTDDGILVDSARVIKPNIILSNGVLHVIDAVLNPDQTDASVSSTAPAFPGATPAPSTSDSAGPSGTVSTTSYSGAAMPQMTGNIAALGAGVVFAGLLL